MQCEFAQAVQTNSSSFDLVTLITVGLTFIASVVSLLTIIEMKVQRIISYKPIIVPISTFYSLKSYSDGRYNAYTQEESEYRLNMYIFLANAGKGTAVNLRINWAFDFNGFLESYSEGLLHATYNDEVLSISGKNFQVNHNIRAQKEENISLLLTAENSLHKLLLPQYMSTVMKILSDRRHRGITESTPELYMDIEYQDTGLKIHKECFVFSVKEKYNYMFNTEDKMDYNEIWRFSIEKRKSKRPTTAST